MATQRKPTTRPESDETNRTATRPESQHSDASGLSLYLPTTLESALLLIYPTTLLLGSIFSTLAPHVAGSKSSYNAVHQSYQPPSAAPSYFAQKRNVFNVFFVKKGWFWTTLALGVFIFTHPSLGPPLTPALTRRRAQATARWAVATGIWVLVTQWCFGPPLVDRSFRLTGGVCELLSQISEDVHGTTRKTTEYFSAQACKLAGGRWTGGHDISGHVFLLILGSAMLWMEVLPTVLRARGLREERRVRVGSGKVVKTRSIVDSSAADGSAGQSNLPTEQEEFTKLGVKVSMGIVGLMWWMLLMTAAFFHTWFEKFTGFVIAFSAVYLIYFLPRAVPELRVVLGMPGL